MRGCFSSHFWPSLTDIYSRSILTLRAIKRDWNYKPSGPKRIKKMRCSCTSYMKKRTIKRKIHHSRINQATKPSTTMINSLESRDSSTKSLIRLANSRIIHSQTKKITLKSTWHFRKTITQLTSLNWMTH